MAKGGDGSKRPPAANDAATDEDNSKVALSLKQASLMKAEPGFHWRLNEDPHAMRCVHNTYTSTLCSQQNVDSLIDTLMTTRPDCYSPILGSHRSWLFIFPT
jgi:hypothetical protein